MITYHSPDRCLSIDFSPKAWRVGNAAVVLGAVTMGPSLEDLPLGRYAQRPKGLEFGVKGHQSSNHLGYPLFHEDWIGWWKSTIVFWFSYVFMHFYLIHPHYRKDVHARSTLVERWIHHIHHAGRCAKRIGSTTPRKKRRTNKLHRLSSTMTLTRHFRWLAGGVVEQPFGPWRSLGPGGPKPWPMQPWPHFWRPVANWQLETARFQDSLRPPFGGSCLIFLGAVVGGVGNGLVMSGMGFETLFGPVWFWYLVVVFGTPSFMSSLIFLQTRDVNGVPLRKRGHKTRV